MHAITRRSNLVFHIDNRLGKERRTEIETALTEKQGVIDVRFNERYTHLLLVEYNPAVTSSFDIMDRVRRQSVNVQRVA